MKSLILLIISLLLIFVVDSIAEQKDQDNDHPPSFIKVYSKDGREYLQGDCHAKSLTVITCDFMSVRLTPPDIEKITAEEKEIEKTLLASEKEKATPSEKAEKLIDKKTILALKEKLNSQKVGPKTKEYLQKLIDSFSANDIKGTMDIMMEHEKHTCEIFLQTFSLEFNKIGKGKWLNNPGPSGICQIVKVYELTSDSNYLWNLNETRVSAGDTESTFCKGIEDELNKPAIWSWRNSGEYELQCDFIKY